MQGARLSLYFLLSTIGYAALHFEVLSHTDTQILLTVLFLIGVGFEKRVARHPFLVLPPAVFSLYCFVNNMLSGALYFAFDQQGVSQFHVRDESVVRGTWYTLVAVQVLWTSFYLLPDQKVRLFGRTEVRDIPGFVIATLTGVAVLAFVIGVSIGAYGYTADQEKAELLSYIRFGVSLGLLAIVLTVVYRYDTQGSRVLLYWLVAANFLMGLAYGSKSMALLPVLLVIVSLYFTGRKINKTHWMAAAAALVAAYMIVEPFRIYYESVRGKVDLLDVKKLAAAYSEALKQEEGRETNYTMAFIERNSYVVPLAKTLEFADMTNYYREEEWGDLALSPLYAVVPRFVWESKPLADFGSWASVHIFGIMETTHTGITPQGYAYLVLRFEGIMLFFLLYGIIQRFVFNLLYLNSSFIAFYILLYLEIGYPAVVPWTYVAGTLKSLVFILPIMAWLIYLNRYRRAPSPA